MLWPVNDDVDALDVFEVVRDIIDPEFPQTLEDLKVVKEEYIEVELKLRVIRLQFRPTVPHCSMAAQIGLSIRRKLEREMPSFKVDISLVPGTHNTEDELNKRLNDKERVVAALENPLLLAAIDERIISKE
mmetsp:Transcript_2142/g.3013  ORF Transcript_2142/g.3013 Transcript_2142/m.3013 type:complete len:131 (+) Transcript_2142:203-595(+)